MRRSCSVSSERSAEMALFFRHAFPPQLDLILVEGQRDIIADSEQNASFLFLLQAAGVAQIQVVHAEADPLLLRVQFPGLLQLVPLIRQPGMASVCWT